jgi:hypothetical protein
MNKYKQKASLKHRNALRKQRQQEAMVKLLLLPPKKYNYILDSYTQGFIDRVSKIEGVISHRISK